MTEKFSMTPVAVTLTGNEWYALCALLAKRPLSAKGMVIAQIACDKMAKQVLAACNEFVASKEVAQ